MHFITSEKQFYLGEQHNTSLENLAKILELKNPPPLSDGSSKTALPSVCFFKAAPHLDPKNSAQKAFPSKETGVLGYIDGPHGPVRVYRYKGKLYPGRCGAAVESIDCLKIDCDHIKSKESMIRAVEALKKEGLAFIAYTTKSNGVPLPHKGKAEYAFRAVIPMGMEISAHTPHADFWVEAIYEKLQEILGLEIDPSSKSFAQYMVVPVRNPDGEYKAWGAGGSTFDPSPFLKKAKDKARKIEEERKERLTQRAEKIEKMKRHPYLFTRKITRGKHTSGDILEAEGSTVLDNFAFKGHSPTSFTSSCPQCTKDGKDSDNNHKKLMIGVSEEGLPFVKCFRTTCRYGKENPNRVKDFSEDFPTIFKSDPDAPEYFEEIPKELLEHGDQGEYEELLAQVYEAFPDLALPTSTIIKAAPGLGKSYTMSLAIRRVLSLLKGKPLEECPLLLIFVPNKKMLSELSTLYKKTSKIDMDEHPDISVLTHGVQIKKKSKVIVSVQAYAAKRGHTTQEYALKNYIKEVCGEGKRGLKVIVDEADAFVDSLYQSIPVGYRYEPKGAISGKHNLVPIKECPTSRHQKYMCDQCHFSTRICNVEKEDVGVINIEKLVGTYLQVPAKEESEVPFMEEDFSMKPSANIDFDQNHTKETNIVFDHKAHLCATYNPVFNPADLSSSPGTYLETMASQGYKKEITIINAGKDDFYRETYDKIKSKCAEGDDPRAIWYQWHSKLLEKLLKEKSFKKAYKAMLPFHPCGTAYFRFYDTTFIKDIMKLADYKVAMSGTFDASHLDVLKHCMGEEPNMVSIRPRKEQKPIDETLLITTDVPLEYDRSKQRKYLHGHLSNYAEECNGPSNKKFRSPIGQHLHIMESKNKFNHFKVRDPHRLAYLSTLEQGGKVFSDFLSCEAPVFSVTYAGSSHTRGANLGEYHSISHNFFTSYEKPIFSLKTFDGDGLDILKNSEKVTGMLQALFRVMRKRKDPDDGSVNSPSCGKERRVMMVGSAFNVKINPKSANEPIEFYKQIGEIVERSATDVTRGFHKIHIPGTSFLNQFRLEQALMETRTRYLESGEVDVPEEKFSENIVLKEDTNKPYRWASFLRAYPNFPEFNGGAVSAELEFDMLKKLLKLMGSSTPKRNKSYQEVMDYKFKTELSKSAEYFLEKEKGK